MDSERRSQSKRQRERKRGIRRTWNEIKRERRRERRGERHRRKRDICRGRRTEKISRKREKGEKDVAKRGQPDKKKRRMHMSSLSAHPPLSSRRVPERKKTIH